MAPIMAIAVAVNYGGKATAQEESSKSLDIILSAPISRESFIIQKIFSMIIKTLFIAITHWFSYFILGIIFSQNIPIEGLSAICFNLFLMGITFGMISVFIGTLSGNSTQAISIGGALALIAYLVANIAPLVDSLSNTKYFALFYYYKGGEPLKNGFHSWHWIPFLAITLTFIFLSIYQFKKRNLL
jgi:ABC-2 type transport system permease protein